MRAETSGRAKRTPKKGPDINAKGKKTSRVEALSCSKEHERSKRKSRRGVEERNVTVWQRQEVRNALWEATPPVNPTLIGEMSLSENPIQQQLRQPTGEGPQGRVEESAEVIGSYPKNALWQALNDLGKSSAIRNSRNFLDAMKM